MQSLLDDRMQDGSRHFAWLPFSPSWERVRDHLGQLEGALLTEYLTDGVTEAWIDFELGEQRFTINNQFDEFWFFVADPSFPEALLHLVLSHFCGLLGDR